ncbi:DNA repair protein RecO [Pseudovibrio sp. SPO723]|uniref:DNA repair protein RecO n=1 Tax=Nesiotobacter zosterae TaxID=392721 RepID=UPI0029C3D120|nr:DNA repair protein RecO [Pseudovibrio sp. SPO723]MDX5592488.1 DNA repair protein RecO [Pseudovibrio sp. SPO723]
MQWTAEGIVIGARKHGDSNIILEVMTPDRGRCLGLVRGGRSRRQQPALQLGNHLSLTWRARLDEHLGNFSAEPIHLRAAHLMQEALSIHALQSMCALLRLLPERDPHPQLFHALDVTLDNLEDPILAGALIARFELLLLNELGFGLDLTECAATGQTDDLIWVSPRSGRAVCSSAGEPYRDKLFPLPDFLKASEMRAASTKDLSAADINCAFKMTGYFLFKWVFEPRGLTWPVARDNFVSSLEAKSAPPPD